jgi:type IV pilus assembly protein PilY1
MIKDRNVWAAPSTYVTRVQSDLLDVTGNLVQDGSGDEIAGAQTNLASMEGWRLDLENAGEKTFSDAVLYNYAVMFTTYSVERSAELGACEARSSTGTSRFYTLNMTNGSAMFDLNGGGTLNKSDRIKVLKMAGLPPKPSLLFPENQTSGTGDGNVLGDLVTAIVGLENVNDWPLQLIPVWWEEVIND